MTQDSMLPPPKKGKSLFLILGAVAVIAVAVVALIPSDESGETAPPEAIENVIPERQVGFRQEAIVLEDEPDAAVDAEVADAEAGAETSRRSKRGPAASGGCNGTLNTAAARSVVNRQRGAVRSCYERRLKAVNNLQGQVMVNVRIGTGGQVSGVNVSGSLRDPEVFGCIRNTVSRWQFPSPEGGCANLRVPFSFTPRF